MIDPIAAHNWAYRGIFLALCVVLIFVRLLPLGDGAPTTPGPDLMLCFTAAWVLRRPEFVPALSVVLVFLLADLLFQRPPGLRAALVLLASEFLRGQVQRTRDLAFAFEWALAAGTFVVLALAERLALSLTVTDQPDAVPVLLATTLTMGVYPLTVLVSNFAFRVRKAEARDADLLGHRL